MRHPRIHARETGDINIVGGGLQGCFFAIALMEELGVQKNRIRIFDPGQALLHNWLTRTAASAMTHLRSNSSHSIHPDFNHLRDFARKLGIDLWNSPHFAMPYHRPSLKLFNDHAAFCLDEYGLEDLHIRETVRELLPAGDGGPGLRTAADFFDGTVIYAGGWDRDSLNIPAELAALAGSERRVAHIFQEEAWTADPPEGVIVVGAGISALQYAIRQAEDGKKPLLLTRRELEIYRFDFDPCYIGPKCRPRLAELETRKGPEARMQDIVAHRFTGTVPHEVADHFKALAAEGKVRHRVIAGDKIAAFLSSQSDDVVLCTGFDHRNAHWSIDGLAKKSVESYPEIGKDLLWAPGIFLTGASAMYRLGPAAANIIGAHLAWRTIRDQL